MDVRTELVLAVILVQCKASCHNGTKLEKYDLVNRLLDEGNCKPKMPPNYNKDGPVTVSVQISIYDMQGLRDETMDYECPLYIRLNWTDERLDYSQLASYDYLTLTGEDIRRYWVPDLYFHHEKEASYHQVFRTNELVYIGQIGSVTYSARLTILSHCQLDLYYYPFDKQNCDIIVQSYTSKADDLILQWAKQSPFKVQGTEYISIIDNSTTSSFNSPYTDPLGNYSTLHANLRFKRAQKRYDVMYIVPPVVFFLVALSSALLLDYEKLKAEIDSRVGICIGMLIATIMLWGGIYAKLPPVAILTMLDTWMVVHVCPIAITLVLPLVLYRRGCQLRQGACHSAFATEPAIQQEECNWKAIAVLLSVLCVIYIIFSITFASIWKAS
ncbi:glutamate-gated chloride channel-like [Mercenaria mercenaria]|uniref:glutamate-gated chloride channel-like n=1 Tax=Mercenaria mercenaria TaxID=6596 RepID=UPI00234FB03E|nr:glutamate-gated chloride channel-like [Mercenaria mercenaria]